MKWELYRVCTVLVLDIIFFYLKPIDILVVILAERPVRLGEERTLWLALGAFLGVLVAHLIIHAVRRG